LSRPSHSEVLLAAYRQGLEQMDMGREIQAEAARENREILVQLSEMLSVPEIAKRLGITRQAVYRHLGRYAKGGAE